MENNRDKLIPALRFHWLTSIYDPIMRWTMRENTFKTELVKIAKMKPGQRVLDLGCGTATLSMLLKKNESNTEIIGFDGDAKVLKIAQKKIDNAGYDIPLQLGNALQLPYPDLSFDCVVSSLMFHHLTTDDKIRSLHEVYRVLRPGGKFIIADWGKAKNILMRTCFFFVQLLDGFDTTNDHVKGFLPQFLKKPGFTEVHEIKSYSTIFGTLSLFIANKGENQLN